MAIYSWFTHKKMVIFNSYVNVYQRPKPPFSDTQMVGDAMVFNMGTEWHHGHISGFRQSTASAHHRGRSAGASERGTNYQRTHKLDVVNVIWWDITCHEWTMVLLESIKHNSEFRFSDSSIPSSWYAKWAAMDKGDYGKELWAHEKLRHIPILVGWTPISSGLRILDGEIAMFVGSNMKNLAGHKKFLDWVRPSTSPGPGECPWLQEVG